MRRLVSVLVLVVALGACTRRTTQAATAAVDIVGQAIDERTRGSGHRPPPAQLERGQLPHCGVFEPYVGDCPNVPRCDEALTTHASLRTNACVNDESDLVRIGGCRRNGAEERCTLRSFPNCRSLRGAACGHELTVCEASGQELALAVCCTDPSAQGCEHGTYFLPSRRGTSSSAAAR